MTETPKIFICHKYLSLLLETAAEETWSVVNPVGKTLKLVA